MNSTDEKRPAVPSPPAHLGVPHAPTSPKLAPLWGPPSSGIGSRLWLIARWTLAVAALAATWVYGFHKGGSMLYWSLPLSIGVMFCTVEALAMPVLAVTLVAVAFLFKIDESLAQAVRYAAATFLAIGGLRFAWVVLRWLVLYTIARS